VTDLDLSTLQPTGEGPKAKVMSGLVVDNAVQAAELTTAAPSEGTAGSMPTTRHYC